MAYEKLTGTTHWLRNIPENLSNQTAETSVSSPISLINAAGVLAHRQLPSDIKESLRKLTQAKSNKCYLFLDETF